MNKIYLDTQIYIYALEKKPSYWDKTKQIIKEVENKGNLIIASTLVLTEMLTKPYQEDDLKRVEHTKFAFLNTSNLIIRGPDIEIAETAGYLRGKFGLRTPNAIHLATALELNCDQFITNDKHFKNLKDLKKDLKIEIKLLD